MGKTIWQHYNMRSRVRGGEPHLVEYLIPDFGDSELSLSDIRSRSISHKSSDASTSPSEDVNTSEEVEIVFNNNTSVKNLNVVEANEEGIVDRTRDTRNEEQ